MKNGFHLTGLAALALFAIGAGVAFADGYGDHSTGSHTGKPKTGKRQTTRTPADTAKFRQFKDLEETQLALVAYLTGKAEINENGQDGAGDPSGRGTATFFVKDSRTLCYSFLVRGMEEPPSNVHIHRAPAGQNANPDPAIGVAIDFTKGVPKNGEAQPSGNPGWSSGCKALEGAEKDALGRLLSNPRGYYVNVHSSPSFPKGAIRGQLSRMLFDND